MKELSKETLLKLIFSYDRYIQNANEKNLWQQGWFPVCINEYYDNEFMEEEQELESEDALQELADQAQDLDLGY